MIVKYFALLTSLAIAVLPAFAQTPSSMPIGEYYLSGVPEMASGFRINADSSFDFFFIYGAVDRFGKGSWSQNGDTLALQSPPKPAPDFVLQNSAKGDTAGTVIQVTDANPAILGYIMCQAETTDGEILRAESDNNGQIYFDTDKPLKTIYLLHRLWPNEPCVVGIGQSGDHYFEFSISPSIMEVAFNNLELRLEDGGLRGGHPLMQPGKEFFYKKR